MIKYVIEEFSSRELCFGPTMKTAEMLAYVRTIGELHQLVINDVSGFNPKILAEGRIGEIAWSPNGERIAFASIINRQSSLSMINIDGTNLRTFPFQDVIHLVWSPDSRFIAIMTAKTFSEEDPIWMPKVDVMIIDTSLSELVPYKTIAGYAIPLKFSSGSSELILHQLGQDFWTVYDLVSNTFNTAPIDPSIWSKQCDQITYVMPRHIEVQRVRKGAYKIPVLNAHNVVFSASGNNILLQASAVRDTPANAWEALKGRLFNPRQYYCNALYSVNTGSTRLRLLEKVTIDTSPITEAAISVYGRYVAFTMARMNCIQMVDC